MDMTIESLAWGNLKTGNYQEAVAIFRENIDGSQSLGGWNGYGFALMLSGDGAGAVKAFDRARSLPNARNSVPPFVGLALWYQGRYGDACADWLAQADQLLSREVVYDNPASNLRILALVWWSAVRLQRESQLAFAVAEIQKLARIERVKNTLWPGSIAPFVLDEMGREEFLSRALNGGDLTNGSLNFVQARDACQCLFYMTGQSFRTSAEAYVRDLQAVVQFDAAKVIMKPEFHLAHYELRNL